MKQKKHSAPKRGACPDGRPYSEPPFATQYERGRLENALSNAVRKHPVFCTGVTNLSNDDIVNMLVGVRSDADAHGTADAIVLEELFETLEAYTNGDYRAACEESYHLVATAQRLARHITTEAYAKGVFK